VYQQTHNTGVPSIEEMMVMAIGENMEITKECKTMWCHKLSESQIDRYKESDSLLCHWSSGMETRTRCIIGEGDLTGIRIYSG
jgi:hypothetical protein